MSVFIGGYFGGYKFSLISANAPSLILNTSGSIITSGHLIDANFITTTYSRVISGTQYLVQVVPQQYNFWGNTPIVNLSTDNTGIATIDNLGNVSYVNTGHFNVIANTNSNSYYSGQTAMLPLTNISGGSGLSSVSVFAPDAISISNHVLIIYNTNSNDSINLKNYYTGHRPLFSGANILGISCPSGQESISSSGFTGSIRQPIINYLTGVSGTKQIRYAVMMCDIPTRISDNALAPSIFFPYGYSVSYELYLSYWRLGLRSGYDYNQQNNHFNLAQFQNNTILTSYINFGSYKDCTSYIDKVTSNQTGIYLTGSQNTGYYIEDMGAFIGSLTYFSGRNLQPLIEAFPSVNYTYHSSNQSHINTGNNLAGYCSWGNDGGMGQYYAIDGTVKWGQNNNWYLILTVDSFNGQRNGGGNFIDWFSSGAFGGTGYNNCPVGAVGNVEEPLLGHSCLSGYFNLWQTGYPFIECAWQSRQTPYFAAFGDPFCVI